MGKDSPKNLALPSKAPATCRVSPRCHYRVYQCPTSKGSKATTALGQWTLVCMSACTDVICQLWFICMLKSNNTSACRKCNA